MLTAIDLFVGAGGLSAGLTAAGIRVVLGIDRNQDALFTFNRAHPDARAICGYVQSTRLNEYVGSTDIVTGGPPCQPVSVHGIQLGEDDERNGFPHFLEAIRLVQPRAVILESVPNLLHPRHSGLMLSILKGLRLAGYLVYDRLMNAASFGVPQFRKRLFLVAFRQSWLDSLPQLPPKFRWPMFSHGYSNLPYVTVGEALRDVPVCEPSGSKVIYAKTPEWRPALINSLLTNGRGRVLDLTHPAPTISAESSGNGGHILDPEGVLTGYHQELLKARSRAWDIKPREGQVPHVRRLTWREAARLQGFPDDYPFGGSLSSIYRQIGNAVPPAMAEAVGRSVAAYLEG